MSQDEMYMREALQEARIAYAQAEVPIGCVIVYDQQIIARSSNMLEQLQDPTAHAEIRAIVEAARVLGSRRLLACTMYVSLEPCAMCAGAIVNARIPRLVYAAADPKAGAIQSLYSIASDPRLNHRCEVLGGVCADDSSAILKNFFSDVREAKKQR